MFFPRAGSTSSAYCVQVSVSLGDKRPLFLPCSPDTCASPTPARFNPQARPAPASLTAQQWGAGTQLGRGGRDPGRSRLRLPPPASTLGGPKTALWRTGRGCLPLGRFISSFFKPCSDFSMSPRPLPRHASLPSPSNLSAQPGERATGLQVIELLCGVGRQARVFYVSAFGFLPLERGWGGGGGVWWRRLWAMGFPDTLHPPPPLSGPQMSPATNSAGPGPLLCHPALPPRQPCSGLDFPSCQTGRSLS